MNKGEKVMKIENNIIKENLKNVYFVCGNACAGKTTMARMLAEKHNFVLYDMDEMYHAHRAIANSVNQPDTCYHGKNFHEQWTRSIEEQARWNMNSLKEQSEMVFIDLMKRSENQTIVADVLFSPDYSFDIVDYNHLIFLTVDKKAIRETYFNRPEKREFYEFVKQQELADLYFENIFRSLELTNELEQEAMKKSGLFMLQRTKDLPKEQMLYEIERHFCLV